MHRQRKAPAFRGHCQKNLGRVSRDEDLGQDIGKGIYILQRNEWVQEEKQQLMSILLDNSIITESTDTHTYVCNAQFTHKEKEVLYSGRGGPLLDCNIHFFTDSLHGHRIHLIW